MTGVPGTALTVGELIAYLRLDSRHFTAGLFAAGKALQATGRDTARLGSQASALTATVVKFGVLAGAANLVGGSLAVLGGGLVTASGSLLLLSGVALAGATALGVLKLGLQGFGDALSTMDDPEKFAESIAKLAPAVQETAVAVRDLKPAWDELRGAVQDELFRGAIDDVLRQIQDEGDLLPTIDELRAAYVAGEPIEFMDRMFWTQGVLHVLGVGATAARRDRVAVVSLEQWMRAGVERAVISSPAGGYRTADVTRVITDLGRGMGTPRRDRPLA